MFKDFIILLLIYIIAICVFGKEKIVPITIIGILFIIIYPKINMKSILEKYEATITPYTTYNCQSKTELNFNDTMPSWNQTLVTTGNMYPPKSKQVWEEKKKKQGLARFHLNAPIIPKSHDLSYWRQNPFVVDSRINSTSLIDLDLSGYNIQSEKKPKRKRHVEITCQGDENIVENFIPPFQRNRDEENERRNCVDRQSNINPIIEPTPVDTIIPVYNAYNKDAITQIIQPDVYSRNYKNEPIISNIGISEAIQFEPTTYTKKNGEVMYTQHDSDIVEPIFQPIQFPIIPTESNIYDPRFTGYGAQNRSYIEPITGQARFAYDDVNSVRVPNYITRSKIDFLPIADKYGPLNSSNAHGNINTCNMREIAQQAFTDMSINQRTDLQERLLRKYNAGAWQQKVAPIRTSASGAPR